MSKRILHPMSIKRICTFVFLFLACFITNAQLSDCSQCNKIRYSNEDIEENTLTELQILRNEIFARHQYVFQNDRLLQFFRETDWYQPDFDAPVKNVKLNDIETANVNLLINKENELLERRNRLVNQLKKLKNSLHNNDLDTIRTFIGDVVPIEEYKYLKGFSEVFDKIILLDLNWYNDTALYQIRTDNGFFVNITELRIKGNEVVFMEAHQGHSEIIKNPFRFGSEYYSEDEYATFWIFSFDGIRLRLKEISEAG